MKATPDEVAFIVGRIRQAITDSQQTQGSPLPSSGRYFREAIRLGGFDDIRFLEFREFFANSNARMDHWHAILSLIWLAKNAKVVGVSYPESLPAFPKEFGAAMPVNEIAIPHLEAFIDLLKRLSVSATSPPAAPKGGGTPVDESKEWLAIVRKFAEDKLIKAQRAVVELVCDGGGKRLLKDIATDDRIGWDASYSGNRDAWRGVQTRANVKLSTINVRLTLRDKSEVVLERVAATKQGKRGARLKRDKARLKRP